jgi:hypothetical protein
MLFSDCAFLDLGSSLLAGLVATELMRDFVTWKVPVRMGIGRGTFYPFKFSTDITGKTVVTRSLFAGTAVVRAHYAERCGGKGLRIFVHPSVEPEVAVIQARIKTMRLAEAYENAIWELDFLHENRPVHEEPLVEEADRKLFEAVREMMELAPVAERRHYTDTIEAMNRMRKANGRSSI